MRTVEVPPSHPSWKEIPGEHREEYFKEQTKGIIKEEAPSTDPIMYVQNGVGIPRSAIKKMTQLGLGAIRKVPGVAVAEGKLRGYLEWTARQVLPEALGDQAHTAAAVISKAIATWKALNARLEGSSAPRRTFWNHHETRTMEFLDGFETGKKFAYEPFNDFAKAYRGLMAYVAELDHSKGIEYDLQNNYVTHLFKDKAKAAEFIEQHYGSKFGDPYFMKDRVQKTLKEMVEKGKLELKFTNPEDIMMARVKASNIAHAKIDMLRELAEIGLVVKAEKGGPPSGMSNKVWRSPNGKLYYAHDQAAAILHNAFETKSMWEMEGTPLGDAYRAGMWIKNKIVPIRLFGLFHAAHVGLLINNAAAATRAGKMILAENIAPKMFMKELTTAMTPLSGIWDSGAHKILKAYWGKIPEKALTEGDKQILTYMQEGGLVPGMAEQDIGTSRSRFKDAVEQGKYGSAAFKLPWAIIDSLQYPMFHIWIPTLKIAAYARDVAVAMHLDPTLANNAAKRVETFAQLRKSVDNRFGEMSYDTLFWQRQLKDVAVLTTLSLGWQMGFIREYGGGALDVGRAVATEKPLKQVAAAGGLDRTMFVASYTAGALMLSGIMSYLLSGNKPEGLDYFYPQTGEKNPDGSPKRVNTPYYTREFAGIYKHMQNEGVLPGLHKLVMNKASGVIGMTEEIFTGVNGLGREIRDPDGTFFQKLSQTLAYELKSIQPISAQDRGPTRSTQEAVLSTTGFSPAPKYATETAAEGKIKATFLKYYGAKLTPYEKVAFSEDARDLRELHDAGMQAEYQKKLNEIAKKKELTAQEKQNLRQRTREKTSHFEKMFKRLNWQQQRKILDEMTPEERKVYLPLSNATHLRRHYKPPVQE
ncbi:hypothetical protein CCP3SC15_580001 [Gammaproteobacteria bacterium]